MKDINALAEQLEEFRKASERMQLLPQSVVIYVIVLLESYKHDTTAPIVMKTNILVERVAELLEGATLADVMQGIDELKRYGFITHNITVIH